MFEPPILTIKGARLSFGTNELFTNVELYINRGDKISLVGRNGCGKSTLLKVIARDIEPDAGEIFVQPGVKVSYMPQDPDFSGYATLREVVLSGLPEHERGQEYRADILIEQFDIRAEQSPEQSSGGERKKAALAKALINEPDILLLDEPTNHLDMPTIEKLEKIIADFRGAVILISHDRMFLSNTSRTTFWLDRGILRRNNKGFRYFEEWQEQVIDQEIIEQKYLNKKIEEETEWLHKGVTARRKRNQGRLRRLQQLRQERREQIRQIGSVKLEVEEGELRSKMVIEAKHVCKTFGDREIVKDFSTRIIKGNKIGIVGPNGAGKTTLIKLLTKRLEPDSGHVRIGKNLEEAYFDQNRLTLDPKKTLWKTLCNEGDHIFVRGSYRHVVAYLKDFLFRPDQAQCPVSALSGGEKNRLMLAVALAQPSNFLVLDEPTNDLDMDTLDLLQEVLDEYEGTILLVSHDRDFIDRVVTSVIYMPGDGSVSEHAGSYSDLLEKLKSKIPAKKENKKEALPRKEEKPKSETKKTGRLSYNQQRLLEILPGKISELEKQIGDTEAALSDSSLYTENPEKFDALTTQLEKLKAELEKSENQWLEIEMLRESIGA
ncbi:MAG: ABC-F family ATP-binding cassette domain-containing protein [Alphaproteobacteria bacterium]|jgi:COG0488: ATPase components of ABC transporters with duplicated ATPase domains|uniref:ABC-F family ATP-binding cassette domain-containing protein n=1 Tax=Candidatus Scatocola faecigallinarum TaxID=2840916 RepID=UPI000337B951|nr:aBC transporter component [Azospirillum sp. CAG:239]